jgi:hypothetical protein
VVVALSGSALWAAQASANIYWSSYLPTPGSLGVAALDGTNANAAFGVTAANPNDIAVDGQYLYWAQTNGKIGREALDGTGVNQSFITTGSSFAYGLAISGQYIYWTDFGPDVGRANLDGTGTPNPTFITGGTANSEGLAVDGQHIYWGTRGPGTIARANLDGTGVNRSFIPATAGGASALAVNRQYIYWANYVGGSNIGRADIAGDPATVNQDFITTSSSPFALAIDGQYIYWSNNQSTLGIGRADLAGDPASINNSFITNANTTSIGGLAVNVGAVSASATSLTFPSQPLDTFSSAQSVTLTDSGHAEVHISRAQVSSGNFDDFLISYDTCSGMTLWPGGTCTIDVRFGPSATGARSATLTVTGNDPAGPMSIALTGTGGALPQGTQGTQGPAGSNGQIELVTCKQVTKTIKVHGKRRKVKRNKCTTKLISKPVSFTTAATRGGR